MARLMGHPANKKIEDILNSELSKQALAKVGNPNVLVNIVSRRVRQLTTGMGAISRPMITETQGMGAADIALLEIIEGKLGWHMLPEEQPEETTPKKRGKR